MKILLYLLWLSIVLTSLSVPFWVIGLIWFKTELFLKMSLTTLFIMSFTNHLTSIQKGLFNYLEKDKNKRK